MNKKICEKVKSIGTRLKVSLILFIIQTPQSDGIPIEFNKKCWPLIEDPFDNYADECFEKGELVGYQKQAVLTLIEKKAKTLSIWKIGGQFNY